jgi:hypothetical protein
VNKAGYEMMVLAGRMIQEVVHQPANASDIDPFFCVLSLTQACRCVPVTAATPPQRISEVGAQGAWFREVG